MTPTEQYANNQAAHEEMITAELEAARARKSGLLAGMLDFPPVAQAEEYRQQEILVWGLEQMEGETRFMPTTRSILDDGPINPFQIIPEVEALIARLRPNTPFLADFRATRLALFRLNPTRDTLRRIWIR